VGVGSAWAKEDAPIRATRVPDRMANLRMDFILME
jgi:hypothetical protein